MDHGPTDGPGAVAQAAMGRALLRDFSIEISPGHATEFDILADRLPAGREVFLTHIRRRPLEDVVQAARRVTSLGYRPVPHLGARSFSGEPDYAAHVARLASLGARSALIVGGDSPDPAGPFAVAADLVRHPALRENGFAQLYFAGHPEGHPRAETPAIEAALDEKLRLAAGEGFSTAIVTQFGFDGDAVADWILAGRRRGRTAPVKVGLAGVTSLARLIKFATLSGVGPSLRFLRSRGGSAARLLREDDPGPLVDRIAARLAGEVEPGTVGLHFFTFGSAQKTLDWLNRRLQKAD